MPIHIRLATIEDAVALTTVQIASWRSTYRGIVPGNFLDGLEQVIRVEKWAERLASPGFIAFVAEDVARNVSEERPGILGFVNGGALREPADTYDGELYAIYLLLNAQRKGTGRALVTTLAAALREQGYDSMLVWVLAGNTAITFYEKLGAVRVTEKPIEIGGEGFIEVALGWKSLDALLDSHPKP